MSIDLLFSVASIFISILNFEFSYYQKELNKAQVAVNYKIIQEPSNIFSYDENMKLGKVSYYQQKYAVAKKFFLQAIKFVQNTNERAEGYYWLGRACLMNNDIVNANLYLSKALELNPDIEKEALFFYGYTLYLNGNYQDALNCLLNYENQIKDKLYPKELLLMISACALGKGDYDLVLQYLSKVDWRDDKDLLTRVNYLLGVAYYLQNDIKNSLDKFNEVVADTNRQLKQSTRLILGKIYFDKGETSKAFKEFETILQDKTGIHFDYAYLYAGICALKNNRIQKALNHLDSLINKYPNSQLVELAYFYKAWSYQQSKKWRQAIQEYKRFLALFPNSVLKENVSYNWAKSLMMVENYREASLVLEEFFREFPNSQYRHDVIYNLVQCYYKLNQNDKVQVYGEKFISNFPSSELINDIHYKLAEIGIRKGDYQYAERHLTAITAGPLFPYALKQLGDINSILSNSQLAINYYNLAEQFATDTLIDEIRFNREKVFLQQGGYQTNLAMLKSFLEKYPNSRKQALVQYEIGIEYLRQNNPTSAIDELNKIKLIAPADT
ncbi:MAG: tetratricopeptide repeat protein, partial [candidate division WOR-3 bacterium]|nr:tetratricopeptide repeat protein [candidate division WOR-3 bacterium]